MNKTFGILTALTITGVFAGLMKAITGDGNWPWRQAVPASPFVTPPIIPTPAEASIPPSPPSPTELMSSEVTAAAQAILSGVVVPTAESPSPWAIPGGNPAYIPASISDWVALPDWLNNQVADYSSPKGGYIMYNGDLRWVNDRSVVSSSLWATSAQTAWAMAQRNG